MMEYITSDGLKLYYEKSGTGQPCIYLHGGPGYWSKSFQYFSEDLLEKDLELVYLDQRGCGRSEHSPAQNYSLNRLIDDMEELRIFLGFDNWYVIGHSFGGILAVNYAYRFPERTKGIILTNATLNMLDSFEHQIHKGSEQLGINKEALQRNNIDEFMKKFNSILSMLIEKETYFNFQFVQLENKKFLDKIDAGLNSDPKFQQYVFSSKEFFQDFTLLTPKIKVPVLIIAGEFDDAVGPVYQNFKFENSTIRVLKSGHHPYIEDRENFRDVISEFVQV
ncbi:alpha/beta hydrolase [Caldibacillus lycopersici]|uniref:Alpha/beta hydrolase n=1 Tax=Perspicuibacillus lycopersici TaxID=1325689 RepID=A0AAE3LLS9_9BACI|nr:alpha/beta hydrolase [Perspicuibacillus lycopersici]MCU9612715.1 alpha/beta hydrolase [Perspicuibacillus lycopersici]